MILSANFSSFSGLFVYCGNKQIIILFEGFLGDGVFEGFNGSFSVISVAWRRWSETRKSERQSVEMSKCRKEFNEFLDGFMTLEDSRWTLKEICLEKCSLCLTLVNVKVIPILTVEYNIASKLTTWLDYLSIGSSWKRNFGS